MSDDWYRSADMLPPLHKRVRVHWAGRVLSAIRTMHPTKKRLTWVTIRDGELEFLPPKGRARSWGDDPPFWQPEDPATWTDPLPAAIYIPEPKRYVPSLVYGAVEEATAADLAREMEADRESARASKDEALSKTERAPLHWWRDATLIQYSPQGSISLREAEGRVMRAICTSWDISNGAPRLSTNAATIARMSYSRLDLSQDGVAHKDWRPPFEHNGRDEDDFLLASSWFNALNPPEFWKSERKLGAYNRAQQILVGRAMDPPLSWTYLGLRYGVTDERVRQIYKETIEKIWRAANGLAVHRHVRLRDYMHELRERNKAYAQER